MSEPRTAREALIAEALGDLGRLLDQTQALVPAMLESRQAMVDAHGRLADQAAEQSDAFDHHVAQFIDKAKTHVVKHIAQQADGSARRSIDQHVKALEEAAHRLFLKELGPEIQRLSLPLQRLYEVVQASANPWTPWLTHVATATVAALVTWTLMSGVWKL